MKALEDYTCSNLNKEVFARPGSVLKGTVEMHFSIVGKHACLFILLLVQLLVMAAGMSSTSYVVCFMLCHVSFCCGNRIEEVPFNGFDC